MSPSSPTSSHRKRHARFSVSHVVILILLAALLAGFYVHLAMMARLRPKSARADLRAVPRVLGAGFRGTADDRVATRRRPPPAATAVDADAADASPRPMPAETRPALQSNVFDKGYDRTRDHHHTRWRDEHALWTAPTTTHMCHNRDFSNRGMHSDKRSTCLFRNICVTAATQPGADPKKGPAQTWYYIHPDGLGMDEMPIGFSLGAGPHHVDERVHITPQKMSLSAFTAKFPEVTRFAPPSVAYYEYNGENFGHMLMDVVLPLFAVMDAVDMLDMDMQMLRVAVPDPIGWSCDWQIANLPDKEAKVRHCKRMYDMMLPMITSRPLKLFADVVTSAEVPTCFDTLVVGTPMLTDDCDEGGHGRDLNRWTLCNHGRQRQFRDFRRYTMANLGIPHDTVPFEHRVVFTDRGKGSSGGSGGQGAPLKGLDVLQDLVRDKFGVRAEAAKLDKLSMVDQLKLIVHSTVHVTAPGGVSFVAVYLPAGATSIRLYTYQFGMEHHIFNYLPYIHVEHMRATGGYVPRAQFINAVAAALDRYEGFGVFPKQPAEGDDKEGKGGAAAESQTSSKASASSTGAESKGHHFKLHDTDAVGGRPCDAWSCSCQTLSDTYGVSHGRKNFGRLADDDTSNNKNGAALSLTERRALREWWGRHACKTDPKGKR